MEPTSETSTKKWMRAMATTVLKERRRMRMGGADNLWGIGVMVLFFANISLTGGAERGRLTEQIYETQGVNVTVIEGKTAILPCSLHDTSPASDSKPLKVVWTDQWSTILTFRKERVIDDERIHVDHTFAREWNLRMERVKYGDQGIYTCQVNTDPVISYTVHLTVVVPPRLTSDAGGGVVEVLEGNRAELVCNATGIPTPTITWFRHTVPSSSSSSQMLAQGAGGGAGAGSRERIGETGQVLVIHNVTRHCKGVYECVAENGVPPKVRKEIQVLVKFKPEVQLPTRRMSQAVGKDTILECVVSAHPQAQAMWRFHGRQLTSSHKYNVNLYPQLNTDTITLSLYISELQPADFGKYNCIASNSLGETSQKMTLSELVIRTTSTTTTPSTTTSTSISGTTTLFLPYPTPPFHLIPPPRREEGGPQADRRVHPEGGRGEAKTWGVEMGPGQRGEESDRGWQPGSDNGGPGSGATPILFAGCHTSLLPSLLLSILTSATVTAQALPFTS